MKAETWIEPILSLQNVEIITNERMYQVIELRTHGFILCNGGDNYIIDCVLTFVICH